MRCIAIMNQKGGVGKTTTAVNLGAALARRDQRVCIIDLDPQAHASLHLGIMLRDEEPSTYDVLVNQQPIQQASRLVSRGLWIVPAHLNLAAAEVELAQRPGRERILAEQIHEHLRGFDVVLLDCPPSLGVLTLNALTAAREVLLPLQPHFLALHGLSKLLHTLHAVQQRLNPELRLTGVVLCMYESGTRLAQEVAQEVASFFAQGPHDPVCANARLFKTRIRRNIRLAEAPSFGQSIFAYSPSSHGAQDYQALADELLQTAWQSQPQAEAA